MATLFYFPEGQPGPVCDIFVDDGEDTGAVGLFDAGEQELTRYISGPFDKTEVTNLKGILCKVDPITGELYDCEVELYDDGRGDVGNGTDCIKLPNGACLDWSKTINVNFGINDNFYVPLQSPLSCTPYDSDINIRPVTFLQPNGNEITKYSIEKSTPVTYPVNAVIGESNTTLSAQFSQDGNSLEVTGSGTGNITLELTWNDDPNNGGTALGSITVGGVTFTQTPGDEEGIQQASISVTAGQTYQLTFSGLNSANSTIDVKNNRRKLCLKDSDGSDCNAEFNIIGVDGGGTQSVSLWSEEGDKYAVWTNPAQCTLPCLEQTVTYQVTFPSTDTYYFEVACDDTGKVYFDEEETPFVTMGTSSILNPNIFVTATGPELIAKQITAGTHTLTVKVTNSPLGSVESETLYIDTNPSWGTITTTAGTAIRDELDGFSDTSGSGLNEVGGFDVPADSPTGKYLSFGTIDATATTVNTRLAEITLNLSGVDNIVFSVIAGDDGNGGERPNDISDTWDVSFDGGSNWTRVAPSKQYANMSFDEYDRTYGNWFDFNLVVPDAAKVDNFTIKFRSGGDTPEIGGTYNGLTPAQFEAAYANSGDVFGLYKIILKSNVAGSCDAVSSNSYDWSKNPGGWYIKICQGCPCTEADNLSWVRAGSHEAWGDLMNTYSVWPSSVDTLVDTPQTLSYYIYLLSDDTLELQYSADNTMTIDWDGTQVASTSSFTSTSTTSIAATAGLHILTMEVTNIGNSDGNNSWSKNPAGGAWLLNDSNGAKIRSSADLSTSSNSNMIWHTRQATGYTYITTVTPLTKPLNIN